MDLTQLILQGNTAVLKELLPIVKDINYVDEYGYTPLIQTVIANQLAIAQQLLDHGADPNQKDITGRSPLHWAVYNNSDDFCELLLKWGADPNAYDIASEPVLTKSVLRQNTRIKKQLLERGADLQFAQDYIHVKLLGHRFELIGSVDIVDAKGVFTEVDYEGFYLDSSIDLIYFSLKDFRHHFIARPIESWFPAIDATLMQLPQSQALLKYDHYLAKEEDKIAACHQFLKQHHFVLPISQAGHAFSVVKQGALLSIIDRAKDTPPTDHIPIYYINRPTELTPQLIYSLAFKHDSVKNMHQLLKKTLLLQEIDQLPIADQQVGNCSWANIEAILPVMKLMLSFDNTHNPTIKAALHEDAIELFHRWQKWDRERILIRVINDFKKASPQRKAAIAALLTAITFQCCDVDNETQYALAAQMLPIITQKTYRYLIDSYKKYYVFEKPTRAGANFVSLLERYDREAL